MSVARTDADRVLAECAASPDDDGPRLVWADLVGGERGELVTIQCDLARGGLPPAEMAIRRQRERELLDEHGETWAGSLAPRARQWRFRRGFVEGVELEILHCYSKALFDEHPLLSSFSILDPYHLFGKTSPRPPRGLQLVEQLDEDWGAQLAALGWVRRPRALGFRHYIDEAFRPFDEPWAAELEQLWLPEHHLHDGWVAEVLSKLPKLRLVDLADARAGDETIAALLRLPLEALVLHAPSPRELYAISRHRSLQQLRVELDDPAADLGAAIRQLHLRALDLGGPGADAALRALAATPMPTLRLLRVRGVASPDVLEATLRAHPEVELLRDDGDAVWGGPRPRVPLVTVGALVDDTGTRYARMPTAWLVRVDRHRMCWELPRLPIHRQIDLGRARDCYVVLPSSGIARRHARITWRDGRHAIQDLGSTNGIVVDDVPLLHAPLVDGARIDLHDIALRYFVGDGAEARARAALAAG